MEVEGNINLDMIIKSTPLVLSSYDADVIALADYYLPYSTGFEIECCNKPNIPLSIYSEIEYIIEAPCEADELKFRIPKGINGIKCLFLISEMLRDNAMLNPNSGIHYHVDFTDDWDSLSEEGVRENSEWILEELDTWEYKGTYNSRKCEFSESRNWTRFKNYTQTMEFRIGEMTFNYQLLFKRISHVNDIVRRLKSKLGYVGDRYLDDFTETINNRIIRLD